MGTIRNPAELKEMWKSWHDNVGRADARRTIPAWSRSPTRAPRSWAIADTGAMWRSQYDMSPEEFSAMYDRLWARSSRSTTSCTATRATKLNQKYGDAVQPATGPIRADLLGNMWAQEWGNIYDVVAPEGRRRHRLRPRPTLLKAQEVHARARW